MIFIYFTQFMIIISPLKFDYNQFCLNNQYNNQHMSKHLLTYSTSSRQSFSGATIKVNLQQQQEKKLYSKTPQARIFFTFLDPSSLNVTQLLTCIEKALTSSIQTIATRDQADQIRNFFNFKKQFFHSLNAHQIDEDVNDLIQIQFQSVLFLTIQFLVDAIQFYCNAVKLASASILQKLLVDISKWKKVNFQESFYQRLITLVIYLLSENSEELKRIGIKISFALANNNKKKEHLLQCLVLNKLEDIRSQQTSIMILKNFKTTQKNIDYFLQRLKDKKPYIPMLVLQKLKTIYSQQNGMFIRISFQKLYWDQIIKILIDGLQNPNQSIKNEVVKFFVQGIQKNYQLKERSPLNKNFSQYSSLIKQFEPDALLIYPRFYKVFCEMLNRAMVKLPKFQNFIITLCQNIKRLSLPNNSQYFQIGSQIILLSRVLLTPNKFKQVVYDYTPSFSQFGHLLEYFVKQKNVLGMYQTLNIILRSKDSDQIARKKMFQKLKRVLYDLNRFQSDWRNVKFSNQWQLSQMQAKQYFQYHRLTDNWYQSMCISSSFDLIFPIIQLMKNMKPQEYQNQTHKIIINSWQRNTLNFREICSAQSLLEKTKVQEQQGGYKTVILAYFNEKITQKSKQISQNDQKNIFLIISLRKLNIKWNISKQLPAMKDEISIKYPHFGLKMTGIQCQQDFQIFQDNFQMFWQNIQCFEKNRLHFLLSLHIVTKISIKFKLFNKQNNYKIKHKNIQEFTPDMLIQRIVDSIRISLKMNDVLFIKVLLQNFTKLVDYFYALEEKKYNIFLIYLIIIWLEVQINYKSHKREIQSLRLFLKSFLQKKDQNQKIIIQNFLILGQTLKIAKAQKKILDIGIDIIQSNKKTTLQYLFKSLFHLLDYKKIITQLSIKECIFNSLLKSITANDMLIFLGLKGYHRVVLLSDNYFRELFVSHISKNKIQYLIFVKKTIQNALKEQLKYKDKKNLQQLNKILSSQIKTRLQTIFNDQIVQQIQFSHFDFLITLTQLAKNVYQKLNIKGYWKDSIILGEEDKLSTMYQKNYSFQKIQELAQIRSKILLKLPISFNAISNEDSLNRLLNMMARQAVYSEDSHQKISHYKNLFQELMIKGKKQFVYEKQIDQREIELVKLKKFLCSVPKEGQTLEHDIEYICGILSNLKQLIAMQEQQLFSEVMREKVEKQTLQFEEQVKKQKNLIWLQKLIEKKQNLRKNFQTYK